MTNKKRHHSKKALLLGILLPIAGLGVIGGATVGVLYATGILGHGEVDINTIFGNTYQWSNNATDAAGTSTQVPANQGSSENPEIQQPSLDAIIENLEDFLGRAGKTDDAIINDLNISATWTEFSGNELKTTVRTIPNQDRYTGEFDIHVFVSGHDLAAAITNHIIIANSETIKASEAAKILENNNNSLNMNAIQFGYINTSSQFVPFINPATGTDPDLSQNVLSDLWDNYSVDSQTGFAYKLAVHAVPNGWYDGQADVVVYLSLARITYSTNTFFGSDAPVLGNNGSFTVPFFVTPTLAQAESSWINAYNAFTSPFDYTKFYTSNPDNVTFGWDEGKLCLTYGEANQFYKSGHTDFTLLVTTPKALSDVFKSTDATPISIAADTATNPLKYWTPPSSTTPTYEDWIDLKGFLLERYTGANWAAFRAADFTCMTASSAVIEGSGTTLHGTITVSPIGNIFYTGDVVITWQVWNYQAA